MNIVGRKRFNVGSQGFLSILHLIIGCSTASERVD
jgi:hypothetical protein